MVFADLFFLFIFLPLFILLYGGAYLAEKKNGGTKARNAVLILFSLILYVWGEPLFILLLLFGVGLLGIYKVFNWKDTSGDYYSSMEQMYNLPKEVIDVAFFGPSVVYCGINPAVLWEEAGIASFNAAISGQDREASYYFVKEFVKKQSPKVVFISGMLFQNDKYLVQGNLYRNTLSMRNSENYKDLVDAVVPNNDMTETNTVWDYYLRWPIIHSRYKEIKKNDFVPIEEYEKSLGYF